jgi:hypothetical protein
LSVDSVAGKVYWNSAGNGLLGVSLPRTTRALLTAKS